MTLKVVDESSVQPLWLIKAKSQRWDEKLARTVLEQQRLSGLSRSRSCQHFGLGLFQRDCSRRLAATIRSRA